MCEFTLEEAKKALDKQIVINTETLVYERI